MKKIYIVFLLCCVLPVCSCSSDDGGGSGDMAYFTTETTITYDTGGGDLYWKVKTGLSDNKYFSTTVYNPETGDPYETVQRYFYTAGRLTGISEDFYSLDFFYDAQGRLEGTNAFDDTAQEYHQRFVYSGEQVFVETLTLAYDNPAAEITQRNIVRFDAEDNIIAAGRDADLDGVMDNVNQFTYHDGNLMSSVIDGGGANAYSYSNVINNFSVLSDNTFGRKGARLMDAARYAGDEFYPNASHSRNLSEAEFEGGEFDVLPSGLFRKSHSIIAFSGGHSEQTVKFVFR